MKTVSFAMSSSNNVKTLNIELAKKLRAKAIWIKGKKHPIEKFLFQKTLLDYNEQL